MTTAVDTEPTMETETEAAHLPSDAPSPTSEPPTTTPADGGPIPMEPSPEGFVTVTHRVLRPFAALGLERERGELVDAKSWRTTATLIRSRYLVQLDDHPDACPEAIACPVCARVFVDPAHLAAHARGHTKK